MSSVNNLFQVYADLQGMLSAIKDDTIPGIVDYIKDHNLFDEKQNFISVMKLLSSFVLAHPKTFDLVIVLLTSLKNESIDYNVFIDDSGLSTDESIAHPSVASRAYVMFLLLISAKLISVDTLYLFEDSLDVNSRLVFKPEFKNFPKTKDWYLKYDLNKSNTLTDEEIIEIRKTFHSSHPIIKMLRADDVKHLQDYLAQNNISFNGYIYENYSEELYIEADNNLSRHTIIDYAAYFGAVNCFKFLMLNQTTDLGASYNFAISGNNYDIIHLIESKYGDTIQKETAIDTAVEYMRNDMIEYLFNTLGCPITAETFIKCIYSSNYIGFLKLLELNQENINNYGEIGSTPFDIAAFEGNLEFVKYLSSLEQVDIKILNNFGVLIF